MRDSMLVLPSQYPCVLAAAALRGIHNQGVALQRDSRQSSGNDSNLLSVVQAVGPQVNVPPSHTTRGMVVGGNARERDNWLRDVVARVCLDAVAKRFKRFEIGGWADQHPEAAGFAHDLHHQFGQMLKHVGKVARLRADVSFYCLEDGFFL